jgi:hypothetical protein
MLVVGVIGLVWLGCLGAFAVMVARAPTIEDMPDHRDDLTDEMVAELRRLVAKGREASDVIGDSVAGSCRRKAG